MLKPIVSMNQMAMNESIATTCCYVWNGTSLLGSASLPHGGSLKASSNTQWYVWMDAAHTNAAELNTSWLGYTDGHVKGGIQNWIRTSSMTGDVLAHAHNSDPNPITVYDAATKTYNKQYFTAGYCDHKNPETCQYFSRTSFGGKFTHTGATSGHYTWTGGNSWLADHTAVQFSS